MSVRNGRKTFNKKALVVGAFIALILGMVAGAWVGQSRAAAAEVAARDARVSALADALAEDEEFFAAANAKKNEVGMENIRLARVAEMESWRPELDAAKAVLAASEGKVSDNLVREQLTAAVNEFQGALDSSNFFVASDARPVLGASKASVEEAQAAWQAAEDARIAAEAAERARAAEAAKARAAAASSSPRASRSGSAAPAPAAAAAPEGGVKALNVGKCLRGGGSNADAVQSIIDGGCTAVVTYGSSPWLAAHNYNAGNSWKAMPDGAQFTYDGRVYQVTGRNSIRYSAGEVVEIDPLVYGDLTLQTCISSGNIVFIHANIVG